MRIAPGENSGVAAEDAVAVKSETTEDGNGVIVSAIDPTGRKLQAAVVGGAAGADQSMCRSRTR